MADEPQPSTQPAQPQTQTQEPQASPLEKVYQDFKIEDTAATFQPQPPAAQPAQPQHQALKTPDPFDPNFGNWAQGVTGTVASLNQAVAQTRQQLSQMDQELRSRKVEADIKQAAGTIAEAAGIDHELAEVHLEVTARKDPKFKSIWDNRDKNPRAYQAALKAVSDLAKEKYTVRQDPQLAENQRAMKVSQQQMATTTKTSDQDEWANMTPADRQRKVQALMRLGGRSG